MIPVIYDGVLQVEHHPGRSGIEHLDAEFGIVGWTSHLVTLILAPVRQLNAPVLVRRRGRQMVRLAPSMCRLQSPDPLPGEFLLATREHPMQRKKEFPE